MKACGPREAQERRAASYARLRGIRRASTDGILQKAVQHRAQSGLYAKAIVDRGDLNGSGAPGCGGGR